MADSNNLKLTLKLSPMKFTSLESSHFQPVHFYAEMQRIVTEKQTAIIELLQDSGCSHAEREQTDSSSNPSFALLFKHLKDLNKFIASVPAFVHYEHLSTSYSIGTHTTYFVYGQSLSVFNKHTLVYQLSDILFDLGKSNSELKNNQHVCVFEEDLVQKLRRGIDYFRYGHSSLQTHDNDDWLCKATKEEISWKLWVFAQRGNPHKVQECIDLGADVDYFGGQDKSTTALHQAVDRQDIETCRVLLKASADVNLKTKQWDTNFQGIYKHSTRRPCFGALKPARPVEKYFDDTDNLHKIGVSTFRLAVETGNLELCKLLIEYGADIHSIEEEPLLHFAVFNDDFLICQELLKRGVHVDTLNKDGQSALFIVQSPEVCDLLIEHGARVDILDSEKMTPFMSILNSWDYKQLPTLQVFESLIRAKSDVLFPDGDTVFTKALHNHACFAVEGGKLFKALVKGGADIEMLDSVGLTPLLAAVSIGLHSCVKPLLNCGANIHAKDQEGNTVLHIWAKCGGGAEVGLFQELVQAGAKTNELNKEGSTVLSVLIKNLQHYSGRRLAEFSDTALFSPFMLETVDQNGDTVLHSAARKGDISSCQFLIEHGADINGENKEGDTPLHVVAALGQVKKKFSFSSGIHKNSDMLECLIEAGADVLAVNKRRETPLHLLVGSYKAGSNQQLTDSPIKYLLGENAFINAKDEDQNSPLHVALMAGQTSNAMVLIDAGANLHECNKVGRAPLHYAAQVLENEKDESTESLLNDHSLSTILQHPRIFLNMLHQGPSILLTILQRGGKEVDVNVVDEEGNTPMHLAANAQNVVKCFSLMVSGANALIPNKAGELPLSAFGPRKPKALDVLLKKQMEDKLLETGQAKLDRVKLFLIGEPAAGKSTLKKTLTSQDIQDDSYTPTAGIDIGHYSLEGAGNFSIWDYAGHEEFHVTHSLFLGGDNAIFLVAYDLSILTDETKAKEYYQKLKHWLSFVKAGNSPTRTVKPIVLLVGTHIDMVDKTKRQYHKQILEELQDLFKSSLNISQCCVAVDCRKKESEEMATLIAALGKLGEEIKGERMVPSLCEDIKREMVSWYKPDYPVLTVKKFFKKAKQTYSTVEDRILDITMDYLHQMGEIYVLSSGKKKTLVVLNPQWFCTTVIAPAFARKTFLPFLDTRLEDKKTYTNEDFKLLYPKFPNHDHLLDFLKQLELIYKIEENKYIMPVKLKPPNDKLWVEEALMTEYYGRRIECRNKTDILSADVFPCLQVKMMKKYTSKKENPIIFLNELKFSKTVEGYIELIPDMQAIQYYVRGRGEKDRAECHAMLKNVESMIDEELEDRSPGTSITKKYLSSLEIRKHKDLHNVRSYTKEQLKEAILEEEGIVCDKSTQNRDEVSSLICKGYDLVFLKDYGCDCKLEWGMTKQADQTVSEALDTKSFLRSDYQGLAEACGISESRLDRIVAECQQRSSITLEVLDEWCKGGKRPTVGDLLHILSTPGLVDNGGAAQAIKRMLSKAGHDVQLPFEPARSATSLPPTLLANRAALRQSHETLCRNADANQLLDHVLQCFSDKTADKVENTFKYEGNIKQMELIIYQLLKLQEPNWWEPLMKGAKAQITHKPQSFIAEHLKQCLQQVLSQHAIFKPLR